MTSLISAANSSWAIYSCSIVVCLQLVNQRTQLTNACHIHSSLGFLQAARCSVVNMPFISLCRCIFSINWKSLPFLFAVVAWFYLIFCSPYNPGASSSLILAPLICCDSQRWTNKWHRSTRFNSNANSVYTFELQEHIQNEYAHVLSLHISQGVCRLQFVESPPPPFQFTIMPVSTSVPSLGAVKHSCIITVTA